MQEAREDLSGRWGLGVATYLVYFFIIIAASLIPFVPLLISGPFSLGLAIFGLRMAKKEHAEVGTIFEGFKNFGDAIAAGILVGLGVGFACLLLLVPGIILALGWSMTFMILADIPNIGAIDAMKRSWQMTNGHKWDLFVLMLKFFLLSLACLFTLGIGFLFLGPYYQTTIAKYYLVLKRLQGYDDVEDISKHLVE